MSTQREIALEQALLSVIAAADALGCDVKSLAEKAKAQILGDSPYRQVDHPFITMACGEIGASTGLMLQLKRG